MKQDEAHRLMAFEQENTRLNGGSTDARQLNDLKRFAPRRGGRLIGIAYGQSTSYSDTSAASRSPSSRLRMRPCCDPTTDMRRTVGPTGPLSP